MKPNLTAPKSRILWSNESTEWHSSSPDIFLLICTENSLKFRTLPPPHRVHYIHDLRGLKHNSVLIVLTKDTDRHMSDHCVV